MMHMAICGVCLVDGEIKLNREFSEFKWAGLEELNKFDIAFKNEEAIRDYWKTQKKT